jgi:hypothetical protein
MHKEKNSRSDADVLRYIENRKLTFTHNEDSLQVHSLLHPLPLVTYPKGNSNGYLREAIEFLMDMDDRHEDAERLVPVYKDKPEVIEL